MHLCDEGPILRPSPVARPTATFPCSIAILTFRMGPNLEAAAARIADSHIEMDLPLGTRAGIPANQVRHKAQRKLGRLCGRCPCDDVVWGHGCRPVHYGDAFRCGASTG